MLILHFTFVLFFLQEKTRLKYQLKKEQKEIEIEEKAKENNSAEIDKQDNSDKKKDEVIANSKLSEGPGLQDGRWLY